MSKTAILSVLFMFSAVFSPAAENNNKRESSLSIGVNQTSGNSDTLMLNTDIKTMLETEKNEFAASALLAYGETEDETTEKNGKLNAQINHFLAEKPYLYFKLDAAYDEIALLDYRFIIGPGLGYYLAKSDALKFSVEFGLSMVVEQFNTDEDDEDFDPDFDENESAATLRILQKCAFPISDTAKVTESVEYLPTTKELEDYLLNIETAIETSITDNFSLRFSALNKYDSAPAPGVEENDFTLKAALVVKMK